MAGAISVRSDRSDAVDGAKVLLIDDVLTSGATSDACVDVLKEAGAKKVVVGCFARVLDEMREPISRSDAKTPGAEPRASS